MQCPWWESNPPPLTLVTSLLGQNMLDLDSPVLTTVILYSIPNNIRSHTVTHTHTYTHTHHHYHHQSSSTSFLKETAETSGNTDRQKSLNNWNCKECLISPCTKSPCLHYTVTNRTNDQTSTDCGWNVYDSSGSFGTGESHRSCVTPGLRCVMTTWHACFFSMRGGIVMVR